MAEIRTKYSGDISPPIGSPGRTVLSNSNKQKLRYKKETRICTWNVKTMAKEGKIYNAIQEMERMKIDIMGIAEMRWPASGEMQIKDHKVFYSGKDNGAHENGVAIMVTAEVARCVKNFVPISDRVMLLQIQASPININIVQIYAPTADKQEEEALQLYESVNQIISRIPKHELLIVMGDFNAKLGAGYKTTYIGSHGLGERNDRGDLLETFAESKELVVLNTFFKQPVRKLYTWKSPLDKPGRIVRNQIDYILVNKRFRNSFKSVKTYPGADLESDHVPLVGDFRVKMKKIKRKKLQTHNLGLIKDENVSKKIQDNFNKELWELEENLSAHQKVAKIGTIVEKIKDKYLKPEVREKRKTWITDEILDLMEERRLCKGRPNDYRNMKILVRRKIREAKEKEVKERCEEIEALQKKHDSYNMHRKVKEATGSFKKKQKGNLTDATGNIIIEKEKKMNTWKEYLETLFYDQREDGNYNKNALSGPEITPQEVQAALKLLKCRKAAGPDNIQTEFLKLLDDRGIDVITEVFNNIYNSGDIPVEWLKSEFIALPKKPSAKKCDEYRTISLMSHLLKLFLKIIHKRIYKKCESQISPNQFGFVNAVGTREALFAIQILVQRCRDVNCDVYICLVDYQKAFDRVKHGKMIDILKETGIDEKDLRIIGNLYWNQTANLRFEDEHTEYVQILRGVRQGCILSPLIFNLYSEKIFREALKDVDKGISIDGNRLNNIRYADDTIVFADKLEDLQLLIDKITLHSNNYGLDINANKTKLMIISKNVINDCHLYTNGIQIERVTKYNYLGTNINEEWDNTLEIKVRIGKARSVFNQMSAVFKTHNLNLDTKMRILRCYVFSVLLYGVESWTLNEAISKKLNAFEMWLYRRMLKIPWTDKVTNVEVLRRMKKEQEIMNTIKCRKMQYLGHIMRNGARYSLLQSILQGKILGRRGPGRRRTSWLKNLRTWFGKTSPDLFRIAADRVRIAMIIANVRNGFFEQKILVT
uniref:Craniofacial development protein 2 n=2 Tax=Cacopsylla melanoneura TaxID=428564 RepID=A0A8D8W5N2_9HEMI